MDSGIAQVLVSMSKYDNKNCNESISEYLIDIYTFLVPFVYVIMQIFV